MHLRAGTDVGRCGTRVRSPRLRDHLPPDGALIPDPRNDENLVVAQTHLAFIRFHNRVVDTLAPGCRRRELFSRPRKKVVRHYQWMIQTDFLPRIVTGRRGRRLHERAQGLRGERAAERVADDAGRVLGRRLPAGPQHGARRLQMEQQLRRRRTARSSSCSTSRARAATSTGPTACRSNWVADFRRLYKFGDAGRPDLRRCRRLASSTWPDASTPSSSNPLAHLPDGRSAGTPAPPAARPTSPSATSRGRGWCGWPPASRWPRS